MNDMLYEKFLNIESLKINKQKIKRTYIIMIFVITVLAFTPSLMATFVGFNFDKGMPLFIFYEMLAIEMIALILLVCIIILDNRYHLFKKWAILLLLPNFLLNIIACTSAYFNTDFVYYPEGGYSAYFNPIFYLFIFLPLYFAYQIFIYYAFIKGLKKNYE